MQITRKDKPAGFEEFLGHWGPVLFDSQCREPIAWGFPLIKEMGEEKFEALKEAGELACRRKRDESLWFFITDRLTDEKAIEKYGDRKWVEKGPRGGFKAVAYGKTVFASKDMRPPDI